LLLGPEASAASLAQLELGLAADGAVTPLADEGLDRLRTGNSAGCALPLLAALARRQAAQLHLEYLPGLHLAVTLDPSGPSAV
jgi:hypothetical protein